MALNPRIHDWSGRRVWLLGASSGIGAALARLLATQGARLALSGRRADLLQGLGLEDALILPCDVADEAALAQAMAQLKTHWDQVDLVVYLAGDYQPMRVETLDLALAERLFEVNFLGAMRVAGLLAPQLPSGGGLALVASVAGYRGLPKALAYGPGKAALIHLAEVLYLDLAPRGVGVWVINPGFVATQLTARNDFAMPALITPEAAAKAIVAGLASGAFEIHFPRRFTLWLKLLRCLPYRLYFPLIRRLTGV